MQHFLSVRLNEMNQWEEREFAVDYLMDLKAAAAAINNFGLS